MKKSTLVFTILLIVISWLCSIVATIFIARTAGSAYREGLFGGLLFYWLVLWASGYALLHVLGWLLTCACVFIFERRPRPDKSLYKLS